MATTKLKFHRKLILGKEIKSEDWEQPEWVQNFWKENFNFPDDFTGETEAEIMMGQ